MVRICGSCGSTSAFTLPSLISGRYTVATSYRLAVGFLWFRLCIRHSSIDGREVVRMMLKSSPSGLRMVTDRRFSLSSGRPMLSYIFGLPNEKFCASSKPQARAYTPMFFSKDCFGDRPPAAVPPNCVVGMLS